MTWSGWLLAAAFFAVSFALSLLFCSLVMRSGIVDAPDGTRKTQTKAVPRLGGVAILLGTLFGTAFSFFILILSYGIGPVATFNAMVTALLGLGQALLPAFVLVAVAFIIGLWDDIWTANTKVKLLVLALGGLIAAFFGLAADAFPTPFGPLDLPLFLIFGSALWLLVFINAANFMDGSNGLSIGCLAIMLAGLAAISETSGSWSSTIWWFPVFGAIAGFLMHNLRGNLYAGDAGSLGLGALFAGLALASGLEVWTVATLALPFLLDVLLTLVWRAKHGRNWLEAHLDHAYQRLITSGWSHLEAAVLYWGLSAVAAALAYIAAKAGGAAPFLVFWTLGLAGTGLWIRHRRSAELSDLGS